MSKIQVVNLSMLNSPSKRYYGSADIKLYISPKKYIYINNVGIFRNEKGGFFIDFPSDKRSKKRNKGTIVPSRELRREITDEVLSFINNKERKNYYE